MGLLALTFILLIATTNADDKILQNKPRGLQSVRCFCKSSKGKCKNYYVHNCSKCICGRRNTNTTPKCKAYRKTHCSKCVCGKKNTNTTPKCKAYQKTHCSKCVCGKKNTNTTPKCKAYQKTHCTCRQCKFCESYVLTVSSNLDFTFERFQTNLQGGTDLCSACSIWAPDLMNPISDIDRAIEICCGSDVASVNQLINKGFYWISQYNNDCTPQSTNGFTPNCQAYGVSQITWSPSAKQKFCCQGQYCNGGVGYHVN